jgi:polysaccharide deacetylase family protein (PEP-CTERM system associated)
LPLPQHIDPPPSAVLLTFDVEEWFQVENFKPWIASSSWPERQSRVVASTERILDLLDRCSAERGARCGRPSDPIRATFFILGWVAERHPGLVRAIQRRGHEIAAHGYAHELAGQQDHQALLDDIRRCKRLLEDITAEPVQGYRSPSFSITPALMEILAESGFRYDSSYNSFGLNPRYGHLDLPPHSLHGIATRLPNGLWELPVSNCQIAGRTTPLGGGGYFRLFPLALWKLGVRAILARQGAYLMYLHPWEFDPGQPVVREAAARMRFRHYLNLSRTESRLESLVHEFRECIYLTCRDYLEGGQADRAAKASFRITADQNPAALRTHHHPKHGRP